MTDHLHNPGVKLLNMPSGPAPDVFTVIVVGVPRSGTTMAARVMEELGFPLFADEADGAREDVALAALLEGRNKAGLDTLIRTRNAAQLRWGFKRPAAYTQLVRTLHLFRNPRLIASFGDPVSVAMRREVSMQSDFSKQLRGAISQMRRLDKFLKRQSCPILMFSHGKAMQDPAGYVDQIAAFCGIIPDAATRARAISAITSRPEEYLRSSHVTYSGQFFGIRDGRAVGWAKRTPVQPDLRVHLMSHGRKLGSDTPNRTLPGIEGPHGFSIPVRFWHRGPFSIRIGQSTVTLHPEES